MTNMGILQPVVALAIWTMVMWAWLYATRIPAMNAGKADTERLATDPNYTIDMIVPPQTQWVARNYNHLHEAPTVFYAIAITLAVIGQGDGFNHMLGWAYVGLRIAHSLVQATVNKIMVRFAIFVLSSLVLMALILHAAMAVF